MTSLHWESTGDGDPVLMIMGLGLSGGAWWRTVPVLSRSLRVITFDNRGVGRSRALLNSYTTEAMADDVVSVLDAAGTCMASPWEAWSRSSLPYATPSACARSCSERRTRAGRARRGRATT
jgi:alpha-beta hydrolase superfamily lysophospholipase